MRILLFSGKGGVGRMQEIKKNWHQIWSYVSPLLHTSGLSEVEAEEMGIFPGMEELSAPLYVNQWHKEGRHPPLSASAWARGRH